MKMFQSIQVSTLTFTLIAIFAISVFVALTPQFAHAAAFDITQLDSLEHTATTTSSTITNSLVKIDDTHFMLAYASSSLSGFLKTFSIDGSYNITEIDTLEHDISQADDPSLVKIDDTHFILAYEGADDDGFIKTFSIDGSYNISEIDSVEHDTFNGAYNSLVQIDSTHYMLGYMSSSTDGVIKTFSIDGSYNITETDSLTHNTTAGTFNSLVKVDATHYMLAYSGSGNTGSVVTFSIDGSYVITEIDNLQHDDVTGVYNSLVQIDSTHYILAYGGSGSDGYVKTFYLNEDYNIGQIDTIEHDTVTGLYNSLVQMDTLNYVLAYTGNSATDPGIINTFSLDGGYNITQESSLEHDSAASFNNSLVKVDSTHFMLGYLQFDVSEVNSADTIKTFYVEPPPLAVTTDAATSVATTTTTINGTVTGTGDKTVTARGFAWGTDSALSGGDTATTTTYGSFSTGKFSSALSSLSTNTTYYFRSFAATSTATTTGSILNFTTPVVWQVGTSTGVQQASTATSWSHSHALPSGGSNRELLIGVFVTGGGSADDVTAVTYDGTSATQLTEAFGGSLDPGLSVWWMPEADLPAGGSSYTLAVTINNARAGKSVLSLFSDLRQTQPTNVDSAYQLDQNSSDHTENLTGVNNRNFVVSYLNDEGESAAFVSDGIEAYDSNDDGGSCGDEGDCYVATNVGSGTVGVTWRGTAPTGNWEKTTSIVELLGTVGLPTVTTDAATSVRGTTATVNGDLTDTGGEDNNEQGFAWGTSSTLSGGDTATTSSFGSFGTGTFSVATSSLSLSTTYYFRAFSANTAGTTTGSILDFTTLAVEDVQIDSAVDTSDTQPTNTSPQTVWTSDTDGYVFYMDGANDVSMSTTTDSGATWSTARTVDSVNSDANHLSVWYDQWTPGDTTGTKIHVMTFDSGVDDTYYTEVDTATGAIATTVRTGTESSSLTTSNYGSITKAEDGTLYVTALDTSDSWVHVCSTTCTSAVNWSAITDPWGAADGDDFPILLPLKGTDNIVLISWDTSTDDIESNIYSATSTSWWGWDTSWNQEQPDNTTYDGGTIGATINRSTGEIYLAYIADADDYVTEDHDIDIWEFDNATYAWSQKTASALVNMSGGLNEVKITIDENTGDLYLIYNRRTTIGTDTTSGVYWRKSTDNGETWGAESSPTLNLTADDIRGIHTNIMSNERISTAWKYTTSPNADDLYHGTVIDLTAILAVVTDAATSVLDTTATINGNITGVGENATERGFAWGTDSALSGGDTATTSEFGSFGKGAFSSNLSSLSTGTTYYFRAFAADSTGTTTAPSILNFTTLTAKPTVTTDAAVSIGGSFATVNGNITVTGGNVNERGFAWGTNSSLSGGDTATTSSFGDFSTGTFGIATSSLSTGTTYYFRAFAANVLGTTTASILNFTTLTTKVEVLIDAAVDISDGQHTATSPQIVWTSDTDGYIFYVDLDNSISMSSTTDSGATWSTPRTVDSINAADAGKVAVWYDQWTPGDTSGTKIHVATFDTGVDDTYYTEVDTATGAIATTVLTGTESAVMSTTANYHSITKAEDGTIYITAVDGSDSWVHKCSTTCTSAVNWSAITDPWGADEGDDFPILLPLKGTDNIVLISWDVSRDDIESNIYSATSTSWWGWDTSWNQSQPVNTTYDGGTIGATINRTTGEIYLAYIADADDFVTEDHDIDIWEFDNATYAWSQKTASALVDMSGGLNEVKITLDERTGDLYLIYHRRSTIGTDTTGAVYWRKSTDNGETWGSERRLSTTDDDIYGIHTNIMSNERISTAWKYTTSPNADDLYHGTVAILDSAPTVTTDAATNITKTTATINGDITAIGSENANERGFAWGTDSALSGGDTATTTEFGDFNTGTFSDALSSLINETTYYFRAYAANSVGTSTGSILSFLSSPPSRKIRIFGGTRIKIQSGRIKIE